MHQKDADMPWRTVIRMSRVPVMTSRGHVHVYNLKHSVNQLIGRQPAAVASLTLLNWARNAFPFPLPLAAPIDRIFFSSSLILYWLPTLTFILELFQRTVGFWETARR